MNFAEAATERTKFTKTENGAVALNTTSNKLLDFYSVVGALRNADDSRIQRLFADAYSEDPLTATKIVFYARDVREGAGERETFRKLIKYMAYYHPESIRPNIHLIGEFGRYDDLYSFIGTPLEDDMWDYMKEQFQLDLMALKSDDTNISLLAKWIKTPDASSRNTRELGILTARKLGYSVYEFKRRLRALRKELRIVEAQMSANKWNEINYSAVPSRAGMIYRNAFTKHDGERYAEFINKAVKGEAKINSGTLYPYDIVEKVWGWYGHSNEDSTLEAQWRQLPNYVKEGTNAIVMADTSGSMDGRPIASALGLAVYFAERNKGVFHNLWMSFSAKPKFHILKGETLAQKLNSIDTRDWNMDTDLKAAFDLVLSTAIDNEVPQEEMPKALIIISDMEIDFCGNREWSFYDKMEHKFAKHGYQIPNVIFWNVNSRHDIYHADATRKGVQLVGGQSTTTFKNLIECIDMTPVEAMYKTLNSERYDCITIEI